MKKRLLLSGLVLGVLTLAVVGWTLDGLAWAFRPARLRSA
jgi:hypothetical protein